MKCQKCDSEMDPEAIRAKEADHDSELIDILIECDNCGAVHNAFVEIPKMVVL